MSGLRYASARRHVVEIVLLKWLLLFALGFLAYHFLVRGRSKRRIRPEDGSVRMVTCAGCGVFFPERDGVKDADRVFCCEKHKDQWGKSH